MNLLDPGSSPPMPYLDALPLSSRAKILYKALRSVAKHVSQARGYCTAVTQVHFFAPGEVVADALCMARSTLYKKLEELAGFSLVEARAHYVTHNGRTKADGMVWAIKLYPERTGRIRVPYDALKKSYRCLSVDIESGRTAWRQIGQSKGLQEKQVELKKILDWALPPQPTQNPDALMTVRADLEQILDVPYAEREDRSTAVDGAARALVAAFGDAGGLMCYRWLLWQLLRLSDAQGANYWHQVYEQARRAQNDASEGFAKKPGALFVSRLKSMPWWDALVKQPLVRVAGRTTRLEVTNPGM